MLLPHYFSEKIEHFNLESQCPRLESTIIGKYFVSLGGPLELKPTQKSNLPWAVASSMAAGDQMRDREATNSIWASR